MKVKFLGGLSIGKSCVAVGQDNRWILLDAGFAVKNGNGQLYPVIPDDVRKAVDGIFITHAHLDHIGGVVHLWRVAGRPPIYMSEATAKLAPIMLENMESVHRRKEGDSLFFRDELEECLKSIVPIREQETVEAGPFRVTAYCAGHIMGAVYYRVESGEQSLVYSGDISTTKQLTVTNAYIPPLGGCDLLILESTYGGVSIPSRKDEEANFVKEITRWVSEGKKILIPAFSLGRAQEIVLLLKRAIRQGLLRCPVFVDGMARAVCDIVSEDRELFVTGRAANEVFQDQHAFWDFTHIFPVETEEQREEVLKTAPSVIIASPGMLHGGASGYYAARFVNDPNAIIAIVGYMDEESPGRLLKQGKLMIGNKLVEQKCAVREYKLSAHADMTNLLSFAKKWNPTAVALVHGSRYAKEALAERMSKDVRCMIPDVGDEVDLDSLSFPKGKIVVLEGKGFDSKELAARFARAPEKRVDTAITAEELEVIRKEMLEIKERYKELVTKYEKLADISLQLQTALQALFDAVNNIVEYKEHAKGRTDGGRVSPFKPVKDSSVEEGYECSDHNFLFVKVITDPQVTDRDKVAAALAELYRTARDIFEHDSEAQRARGLLKRIAERIKAEQEGKPTKNMSFAAIGEEFGMPRTTVYELYKLVLASNIPADQLLEKVNNAVDLSAVIRTDKLVKRISSLIRGVFGSLGFKAKVTYSQKRGADPKHNPPRITVMVTKT